MFWLVLLIGIVECEKPELIFWKTYSNQPKFGTVRCFSFPVYDERGNLYLGNKFTTEIQKLDRDLNVVWSIITKRGICDLAVDRKYLYVLDSDGEISCYNTEDGAELSKRFDFADMCEGKPEMIIGGRGVITCYGCGKVWVFDSESGKLLTIFIPLEGRVKEIFIDSLTRDIYLMEERGYYRYLWRKKYKICRRALNDEVKRVSNLKELIFPSGLVPGFSGRVRGLINPLTKDVLVYGNRHLSIFKTDGKLRKFIDGFISPLESGDMDEEGNVYLISKRFGKRYDEGGRWINNLDGGERILVSDGYIYISSGGKIKRCEVNGKVLETSPDGWLKGLDGGEGLCFGMAIYGGRLYFTSYYEGELKSVSALNFIKSKPKIALTGLSFPGDIVFDEKGNLYIGLIGENKVKKYDSNMNFLWEIGPMIPQGMDIYGGYLYIADLADKSVMIYTTAGKFVKVFKSEQISFPVDVSAESSWLLICDRERRVGFKYAIK